MILPQNLSKAHRAGLCSETSHPNRDAHCYPPWSLCPDEDRTQMMPTSTRGGHLGQLPQASGRIGGVLSTACAHTHTRARIHTHASAHLVWALGAPSPVINSQEAPKCYFREETKAALKTTLANSGQTNHTVDKQTTSGAPVPPDRTPAPELGPPTRPFPRLRRPQSAFTAVFRCKSGTLGNEREIVREGRAEFK